MRKIGVSLQGVNKNRATMQTAKLDFLNRAHLRIKLADHSPVDQGGEGEHFFVCDIGSRAGGGRRGGSC
jgi:hypothetical protein